MPYWSYAPRQPSGANFARLHARVRFPAPRVHRKPMAEDDEDDSGEGERHARHNAHDVPVSSVAC
jgi:hypothetical protein